MSTWKSMSAWKSILAMVLVAGCSGEGGSGIGRSDGPTEPLGTIEPGQTGGPSGAPNPAGANGETKAPTLRAFYIAYCRQEAASFACHSYLMKFDAAQPTGFRTVALPRVDQAVTAPAPNVRAAIVDPKRGLAFQHGGCTGTYIVTDLRAGSSKVFAAPPGVPCLQELVYDEAKERVVAIGGKVIDGSGSTVDAVVELGANGETKTLFDLRSQVARDFSFLHPFKELVSFDSRLRLAYSPLLRVSDPGGARFMLRVNIDDGTARVLPWQSGIQHQFYDAPSDATYGYDCSIPDMVRVDSFTPLHFTQMFTLSFGALTIDEICRDGFTGAAFDPQAREQFILFRQNNRFSIATSNIGTRKFLGLRPTDATAKTFEHDALPRTTFWSMQYVPALP